MRCRPKPAFRMTTSKGESGNCCCNCRRKFDRQHSALHKMKRYFWQDSEGLVKNELISINNHPLPVNRYFWLQWEKRTNPLPKPDAAIFCNRGNAKQAKGDLDGAIADYDQAIAIQPNFAEYYRNRSVAKKRKGELEAAMADCNKAI